MLHQTHFAVKGGFRTFAALGINGSKAQLVNFAKWRTRPKADLEHACGEGPLQ
jgi:hypothetical protein